jgi:Mn-dependent DtxR family transcriptional regulator
VPHYVIEPKQPAAEDGPRLRIVEAKNQARALSHVVEDTLVTRIAEPKDFVTLTKAGGEIESAK